MPDRYWPSEPHGNGLGRAFESLDITACALRTEIWHRADLGGEVFTGGLMLLVLLPACAGHYVFERGERVGGGKSLGSRKGCIPEAG